MKTFLTAWLLAICMSGSCVAQLTVNPDWRERVGLTVASSQTISVPATKFRCFMTLESADKDARVAVANIKAKKRAALEALSAVGVPEKAVHFTSTRILEWDAGPKSNYNYYTMSNMYPLRPAAAVNGITANAHISFDVPIAVMDFDELLVLPLELCERLRKQPVFENGKFVVHFIGEITDAQIKDATKKAYDEAHTNAKSIAELSGRSLGKLAALTPEIDGRWRYWNSMSYPYWGDGTTTTDQPQRYFSVGENEVFGSDPSQLTRTVSVELRFEIQ